MSSVIKVCEPGFEENPDIQKIFRNHINDDLSVYLTKIGLLKRDLKSKQWSIEKIKLLNKNIYKSKINLLLNKELNKDLNKENLISEEEIYLPNNTNDINWALYTCLSILQMKINKIVPPQILENLRKRKKPSKLHTEIAEKFNGIKYDENCTEFYLAKFIKEEIVNFKNIKEEIVNCKNIIENKEHYIRYISFVTDFIKETLNKINKKISK